MQLIPVLEVRHGKSVHTEQKNAFANKIVAEDPLDIVNLWYQQGIRRIHFVDVDGIETDEPCNVDLVTTLKKNHPDLCIQVLGGITSVDYAFVWMDAGADYLVLTGKAMRQKNLLTDICVEFPERVIVEVDCRNGSVGMGTGEPEFKLATIADQLEEDGVTGLVVTEVPNKGHVNYSNLAAISEMSNDIPMPIFANGGIETLDDISRLLENQVQKLTGIIIGKVVFKEDFCLNTAQKMLQ
jgi:phosphoribosylformimino-5-aminoimidazole carboxamide ribotide isomerase